MSEFEILWTQRSVKIPLPFASSEVRNLLNFHLHISKMMSNLNNRVPKGNIELSRCDNHMMMGPQALQLVMSPPPYCTRYNVRKV